DPMTRKSRKRRERLMEAARGYMMLGMPDHALRELDAIEDPGSDVDYFILRGEALRDQCDYAAALKAYSRALAEQPDSPQVLLGMAWCYKRTNQLPQAIAATEQALRIAPDEPIVPYNLSCYYALTGEKAKALHWLEVALQMEPALVRLIA